MASEAICVTASGRASKMTASRPSGQLTFSSSRPVVELGAIENAADRVGQSGDGANAFDHGLKLVRRELQAIDKSVRRFAAAERRLRFAVSAALAARISARGALEPLRDLFERLVALVDGAEAMRREACLAACGERRGRLRSRALSGEEESADSLSRENGVEDAGRAAVGDDGGPARLRWRCARLRAWFPCRRGRGHCRRARSRGLARRGSPIRGSGWRPGACGSSV